MGFEVLSQFKVDPTADEELFKDSWLVIETEVMRLLELGWAAGLCGDAAQAVKYYQAANVYFYFVYIAQAARMRLDLLGSLNKKCNATEIDSFYGLSCIEENLQCLSVFFDTDYRQSWDEILEIFGVDRQITNCSDCCLGLGDMVIGDENDCVSFIVGEGTCGDNKEAITPNTSGEFKLGEFKIGEFTNFNEI